PQTVGGQTRIAGKGVAIVLALDRSSSMSARDFPRDGEPTTRLEAAKQTFATFVRRRSDDLIGLVAFANYPDPNLPPTLDHAFLVEDAERLRTAKGPGDDGTNLGFAIVAGLESLKAARPTKKVLILLTDGADNPAVEPDKRVDARDAAQLA